ncbi:hypothetical protein OsI_17300 [Oryza sativa Indica Group]|uniref:Uncharacterized protein n=1 Tax=Oryza sativa subsp. indica TaxID=39946 RepID=B8ATU7_ORYSI|nr:hypothetical protein OsI_17300 [Oryza sativa Indica Group]
MQLTAPDDRVENDKLGAAEEELVSKAEAAAADVGASIGKVGAASAVENTSGRQGEGLTVNTHTKLTSPARTHTQNSREHRNEHHLVWCC